MTIVTNFNLTDYSDIFDAAADEFGAIHTWGVEDIATRDGYADFIEEAESFFEEWFCENLPELYSWRSLEPAEEVALGSLSVEFGSYAVEVLRDYGDQQATYDYLRACR